MGHQWSAAFWCPVCLKIVVALGVEPPSGYNARMFFAKMEKEYSIDYPRQVEELTKARIAMVKAVDAAEKKKKRVAV